MSHIDSKVMGIRLRGGARAFSGLLVLALALNACDTPLPDVGSPGTRPHLPQRIQPVHHHDGRVVDDQGQPLAERRPRLLDKCCWSIDSGFLTEA